MTEFPAGWWRLRPLIIAHRGASHAAPENTLAAFRLAAEVGADGVELDVHLSRDGVPVVMHNAHVEATTNGHGAVAALTLKELKALDAGSLFAAEFAGEPAPTLAEVLEALGRRLLINIELKSSGSRETALERAVVALVQSLGLTERVWCSSFKPYALHVVRTLTAEIPCGLLYGPLHCSSRLLEPVTPHEALHPHHSRVTPRLIRRAHRRGLRVGTWTVDDVATARRFAAWGIDFIITNEPARLRAALDEGGA